MIGQVNPVQWALHWSRGPASNANFFPCILTEIGRVMFFTEIGRVFFLSIFSTTQAEPETLIPLDSTQRALHNSHEVIKTYLYKQKRVLRITEWTSVAHYEQYMPWQWFIITTNICGENLHPNYKWSIISSTLGYMLVSTIDEHMEKTIYCYSSWKVPIGELNIQ